MAMNRVLEKLYRGVARALPDPLAGRVDMLRPSFAASWGGPLNGQERRREIVRELARAAEFDRVIETGTYRGTSTEFFAAVFGCPISTVEGNRRFYTYAAQRLRANPQIEVTFGDSRTFLRGLTSRLPNSTVFVYLDAHWEYDLPLAEELEIIADSCPRAIVMIDDFEVPGDSGYEYDDYGPGKALVADYLPAAALHGWELFYPSAPSGSETGARRGSCVLVSPALAPVIEQLSTLRHDSGGALVRS